MIQSSRLFSFAKIIMSILQRYDDTHRHARKYLFWPILLFNHEVLGDSLGHSEIVDLFTRKLNYQPSIRDATGFLAFPSEPWIAAKTIEIFHFGYSSSAVRCEYNMNSHRNLGIRMD